MLKFYNLFSKKSYKKKVILLIKDLTRIHNLYNLQIEDTNKNLDISYKLNLDISLWDELNKIYFSSLSYSSSYPIFKKFLDEHKTQKDSKYTLVDTFSGCGGLSLGLKNSGFNPILVNEIIPTFLETNYLNNNLDISSFHLGDIADLVTSSRVEKLVDKTDLFVGGPPCQGFSMANRQRLLNDPRNILYKHFLNLAKRIQPKFILMENVRGMYNKINEIQNDFKAVLGSDYTVDNLLLNAKNFSIPQNRERVFVLATKVKGVELSRLKKEILSSKKESKFVLGDAIMNLPPLGKRDQKNKSYIENEKVGYKITLIDKLNKSSYEDFINKEKYDLIFNHINRFNNDRDIEIFSRLPQGANSLHESIEDIMPYKSRNEIFKDKYYKLKSNDICKTITSHMRLDCNMYIHPFQARGLSPREAARVQSFPDNFILTGPNNSWYQQIGNAVPVKLAEVLGNVIIKYI